MRNAYSTSPSKTAFLWKATVFALFVSDVVLTLRVDHRGCYARAASDFATARPSRSRRLTGDDLRLRGPTEPLLDDKILPNKFDDLLIYLSGLQVSSMILILIALTNSFLLPVERRQKKFQKRFIRERVLT